MVWIAATLVVCAVAAQSGKRNLLAVAIVLSLVVMSAWRTGTIVV